MSLKTRSLCNVSLTPFTSICIYYLCLSDGMTVFSPVSSARYRRSSVSINPSCPSQVSVCVMMIYIYLLCCSVSPAHPASSSSARPSLSVLSDRRQTHTQEAGEESHFFFISFNSDKSHRHENVFTMFVCIITVSKWTRKCQEDDTILLNSSPFRSLWKGLQLYI